MPRLSREPAKGWQLKPALAARWVWSWHPAEMVEGLHYAACASLAGLQAHVNLNVCLANTTLVSSAGCSISMLLASSGQQAAGYPSEHMMLQGAL